MRLPHDDATNGWSAILPPRTPRPALQGAPARLGPWGALRSRSWSLRSRSASGGELSRVMLAIEVVLGDRVAAVPTYVFDEVDAGVGGAAAVDVGARLARLARSAQVIVVTHLPQVAAFADRHYVVTKATDGQVTASDVRQLTDDEREIELARMMAGTDSATARSHAAELRQRAIRLARTG